MREGAHTLPSVPQVAHNLSFRQKIKLWRLADTLIKEVVSNLLHAIVRYANQGGCEQPHAQDSKIH